MSPCNGTGKRIATDTERRQKLFVLSVVMLCSLAQCMAAQDIAWKIVTDVAAKTEREGRITEAEEGYQRALNLVKESSGPASPDVAIALNHLAIFYHASGQNAKAEPFLAEALAIDEKTLGAEDPRLAPILNSFAALDLGEGGDAEAKTLYERALQIEDKPSGVENSGVATSLNGLAQLCAGQGQYAQAEALYKRSLTIREKTLADDDLDLADTFGGYSAQLKKTKRESEAEEMEARAEAIRLAHGAKPEDFSSPLQRAPFVGDTKKVETLIAEGADANASDALGATPLLYAALLGHRPTVELLLAKSDANTANRFGATPLHAACIGGGRLRRRVRHTDTTLKPL